jgi:hypothetical protein
VRLLLLLTAVLIALAAAPAAARRVEAGTIHPGRGAAGVRLDMTRAQVVRRLGRPLADNGMVLSYARPAHGIFDVYRDGATGRVRMLIIAGHDRGWRLADGTAVFAPGAVRHLKARYGARLKRVTDPQTGDRMYVLWDRYHHRRVRTEFYVNHFGAHALVRDVFLLFWVGASG